MLFPSLKDNVNAPVSYGQSLLLLKNSHCVLPTFQNSRSSEFAVTLSRESSAQNCRRAKYVLGNWAYLTTPRFLKSSILCNNGAGFSALGFWLVLGFLPVSSVLTQGPAISVLWATAQRGKGLPVFTPAHGKGLQ